MVMNLLLAQQELPPGVDAGILAALGIFLFIGVAVGLAIGVVICYLLYSCFERIPPQHRQMESWQVFLLLIPCFNIVWNFFVLPKLARSYQSYFAEQGRTDVGDCGEQIGLYYAICCAAGMVLSWVPLLGLLAFLLVPASLVLGIIYLVKVLTLKGQIAAQ